MGGRIFSETLPSVFQKNDVRYIKEARRHHSHGYSSGCIEIGVIEIPWGYIRKLCHDIGEKLGIRGHMAELIRTKAAIFRFDGCFSLQDLADAVWYYQHEGNEKYIRHVIQPIEAATTHLPKVYVLDSSIESLCHGVDLAVPGISKVETEMQVGELVALLSLKGELIALGLAKMTSGEMLNRIKGMAVKVDKVFMLAGTYPRFKNA